MSYILPVILILLSMVIFAFLQLSPSLFIIFYHSRLAKTSKKRADDQSLSYILGTEIYATFIWIVIYFIIFAAFLYVPEFGGGLFPFIMAGVFFAEAIIILFFYFRRKKSKSSTALFISRRISKNLIHNAEKANNRTDCITLGFMANLPELFFTLPVFIVSATILQNTPALPRAIIIIALVCASTVPLLTVRRLYHTDHNLAEIQRLHVKLRPHIRFILTLAYFALALTIINMGILQNG